MSRLVVPLLTILGLVIVAVAVAAGVEYVYDTDLGETISVGLAVLVFLILVQSAIARGDETSAFRRRVEDLANLDATLSRTLQGINGRVARLERRDENRSEIDEATLLGEIEKVRTAAARLADAVTDLELRVDRMAIGGSANRGGPDPAAEGNLPRRDAVGQGEPDDTLGLEALIEASAKSGAIELFLQPLVTLPQRRVRYYDVLACLRTPEGAHLWPARYRRLATKAGLIGGIDRSVIFRAVQIMRRLSVDARETGLFCRLSLELLRDEAGFAELAEFMNANRALAESLVFEIDQPALKAATPADWEKLAMLTSLGFRLSMTEIAQFDDNYEQTAARGVRFARIPAARLLGWRQLPGGGGDAADLSDALARAGIDLVATEIGDEAIVVELLDRDVRFGQGNLFAQPKPLRSGTAGSQNIAPSPSVDA
jgi:cyclic-di-GMP phosphodiesterase TipF (flagellum assembly factor)